MLRANLSWCWALILSVVVAGGGYITLLAEYAVVHVMRLLLCCFLQFFWEVILFFFKMKLSFVSFLFGCMEVYVFCCLFMWGLVIFFEL
jgi:hypothetical protein